MEKADGGNQVASKSEASNSNEDMVHFAGGIQDKERSSTCVSNGSEDEVENAHLAQDDNKSGTSTGSEDTVDSVGDIQDIK